MFVFLINEFTTFVPLPGSHEIKTVIKIVEVRGLKFRGQSKNGFEAKT